MINKAPIAFKGLTPLHKTGVEGRNRYWQRLQMVALNHNDINCRIIARFVGCDITTVYRWISCSSDGRDLHDLQRSGRPHVYTEDIQLKTIAFYCQISPLPGCDSWTLRWAEGYLKEHRELVGDSMSYSTIQRILKNHSLRPHLHKYFLSITDPDFFPKMEHIIDINLNPPDNLFYYDECTGLQAKTPLAPDLPTEPGQKRCKEFEYERHGTTDLMAFLNRKTGKVYGRCVSNHCTETLVDVFKGHVNTLPSDATIHYVMDNLNTHFNDHFCQSVAELSNVTYTTLKTGKERRQWLQSEDKRIVVHFTPFHGSWLNMIEIWFGILSKKCLKHQSFKSVAILQEKIIEFIETWNNFYAHPFKWKYTGEGLHEKAISRFNKLLLIESGKMDIKFLTKQLLLMFNIVQVYYKILQSKEWLLFSDLILSKSDYINKIISGEIKEKKKIKALQALDKIKFLLT